MKTIGLIGGMSWESTVTYYQIINTEVKRRLGGLHSAKCVLYSVDFQQIEACQAAGDWQQGALLLLQAAHALEAAGADFILICTNTMHKVAGEVQAGLSVPLLHIADATADALLNDDVHRALLLGTRYTMEQDFYTKKLVAHGIEPLVPDAGSRSKINSIIFEELCLGIINEVSRKFLLEQIDLFANRGAAAAILGCTELGLLLGGQSATLPLYDTAILHAKAAADAALAV